MRPGDLVEFKAGTFGIAEPENYGLYLDRVKRKGDFFIVLYTVQGQREFKRERVGRVVLQSRVPASALADEGALGVRLRALLKEARSATTRDAQAAAEEGRDRDLWKRLDGGGRERTPAELAAAFFDVATPGPEQVAAVRKILESCARPGVGYFERLPGDERWKPLARDEYRRITEGREGLQALRNRLVKTEEVEEEGRRRTVYRPVPVEEAQLADADRGRLLFVRDVMEDYVLHDRLTKPWGVGGTHVNAIDGWSLFETLKFLALDWTGSRATVSSAFVEFLLGAGLWTPRVALEALAKRKVLAQPGFSWDMDEHAVREAAAFPEAFPSEWLAGRKDFRATECYTIDPPDAKDFDDAVGVDRLPDGAWLLRVHIADVSHYVRPGGRLDRMARERATSLYLPTGVLPMLPPRLSEDLCSLRAARDRLAMSVEVEYGPDGTVRAERFHEAVIRVRANKTYGDVEAAIGRGEEPFSSMARLAEVLQARRRGLALETGEVRMILEGDTIGHHVKFGTVATKMIEAFMVAANEAVARHLAERGIPQLFRCHPLPDRSGVRRFNAQMRTMNVDVEIELPEEEGAAKGEGGAEEGPSVLEMLQKGNRLTLVGGGFLPDEDEDGDEGEEDGEAPPPPIVRGLAQLTEAERDAWLRPFRDALLKINAVPQVEWRDIVYVKLLSCMGRAFYTPDNLGHFGLGSDSYQHFTSPIRRYPDLVCHRQLRALLRSEAPPHDRAALLEMAPHASDQGSAAEDIERTVVGVALLFEERQSKRPWPRPAWVNGVTKKGIFLTLGHGLEARVFPGDIPGGPFDVDENDSYLFVGTRSRPGLLQRVDAKQWRERLSESGDELVDVKLRLGDRVGAVASGFDYVDGRVVAKLVG